MHYPLARPQSSVAEPLYDPSELPHAPCSRVVGHPIELGHEGYLGIPVFALQVDAIEDALCP